VLVHMEMNDDSWHLVKDCPKVMGFIGGKADKPAPITDKEADAILSRLRQSTDAPRPKTLFEPGEVVRVVDGPFADFNGAVEEVHYEKSRLRVAVMIFGRATPVDLEFNQVEIFLRTLVLCVEHKTKHEQSYVKLSEKVF